MPGTYLLGFDYISSFECGHCKKLFNNEIGLKLHIRKTHNEKYNKRFECSYSSREVLV